MAEAAKARWAKMKAVGGAAITAAQKARGAKVRAEKANL